MGRRAGSAACPKPATCACPKQEHAAKRLTPTYWLHPHCASVLYCATWCRPPHAGYLLSFTVLMQPAPVTHALTTLAPRFPPLAPLLMGTSISAFPLMRMHFHLSRNLYLYIYSLEFWIAPIIFSPCVLVLYIQVTHAIGRRRSVLASMPGGPGGGAAPLGARQLHTGVAPGSCHLHTANLTSYAACRQLAGQLPLQQGNTAPHKLPCQHGVLRNPAKRALTSKPRSARCSGACGVLPRA